MCVSAKPLPLGAFKAFQESYGRATEIVYRLFLNNSYKEFSYIYSRFKSSPAKWESFKLSVKVVNMLLKHVYSRQDLLEQVWEADPRNKHVKRVKNIIKKICNEHKTCPRTETLYRCYPILCTKDFFL